MTAAGAAVSVALVRGRADTGLSAASDGAIARAVTSAPPGRAQAEESELYRRLAVRPRLPACLALGALPPLAEHGLQPQPEAPVQEAEHQAAEVPRVRDASLEKLGYRPEEIFALGPAEIE